MLQCGAAGSGQSLTSFGYAVPRCVSTKLPSSTGNATPLIPYACSIREASAKGCMGVLQRDATLA